MKKIFALILILFAAAGCYSENTANYKRIGELML